MSAEGTESLEAQRLPSHLLGAFGYVEGTSHRKCIAEEEWQLLTASQALPTAVKASQLNLTSHSQRSCSPRMCFKEKKSHKVLPNSRSIPCAFSHLPKWPSNPGDIPLPPSYVALPARMYDVEQHRHRGHIPVVI